MPNGYGHISISNFKGIERLEMDVHPFTVLIGPQSVGKSVTAELLFFFQKVTNEIINFTVLLGMNGLEQDKKAGLKEVLDRALISRFEKLLQRPTHFSGESIVEFRYSTGKSIRLWHPEKSEAGWNIQLPEGFFDLFEPLASIYAQALEKADFAAATPEILDARRRLENFLEGYFGKSALMKARFIPAGRAYFAKIERDVASYFESANLDPIVAEFGKFYSKLRTGSQYTKTRPLPAQRAQKLTQKLISGEFFHKEGKDFIDVSDGRTLPASMWSSGQLEALPLVLALGWCCEGLFGSHGLSLFIEEPEAHLFPESQQIITQFIALAFNENLKSQSHLRVFLTTHSPYILTSINNLTKAGQLYTQKPQERERITEIVPKEFMLNPADVGAFYMDSNGCRSITSEDTGLIDASAIDDVSGRIAEQFDALLNLQFA